MPKTVFTQEELNDFLKARPEAYGCYHKTCIGIADSMRVHADGTFPIHLIRSRRPNEPLDVFVYRELIFKPKTKSIFSKIYSSLQKIRRSSDWNIKYADNADYPKIADDETLEAYCEYSFPYFTSLTNWVFSLLLRKYLIDPNAVVFVYPLEYEVLPTEYLQPFPEVFDNENVLMFVPEDYAVLKMPAGCTYTVRNKPIKGDSFFIVTTLNIFRWDQQDSKGNYALTVNYNHNIGVLPVFKLKGILVNQQDNQFLYESRIGGIIPELDEALREYSDLQAAKVLHIYPERWEYTQNECTNCKGTGKRINPLWLEGQDIALQFAECHRCAGSGYIAAGPYSKIMIRPTNNAIEGGTSIPTPPAGYVEKDVTIVSLQETGVQNHIYNALAAINFEFLADSPLAQSGIAKEVDRDELNNTVNSIAEDLVAVMDNIYYVSARYRYKDLYSLDDIDEMLPTVNVPQQFDLLSATTAQTELTNAKKGLVNPIILSAMEIDYASKRFNSEPEFRDMLQLVLTLDPLPNVNDADKMTRLSNKGITQQTYIISSNIQEFVQRAISEDKDFAEKEIAEQKKVLTEYAQEQIDAMDTATTIMQDMHDNIYGVPIHAANPDTQGNPLNNTPASAAI